MVKVIQLIRLLKMSTCLKLLNENNIYQTDLKKQTVLRSYLVAAAAYMGVPTDYLGAATAYLAHSEDKVKLSSS